jgi:hypothetical protein
MAQPLREPRTTHAADTNMQPASGGRRRVDRRDRSTLSRPRRARRVHPRGEFRLAQTPRPLCEGCRGDALMATGRGPGALPYVPGGPYHRSSSGCVPDDHRCVDGLSCTMSSTGNLTCANSNREDEGVAATVFHNPSRCVTPDLAHAWARLSPRGQFRGSQRDPRRFNRTTASCE